MTIEKIDYPQSCFEVSEIPNQHSNEMARLGKITTPHGEVHTPNFVFCGTRATVKAVPGHRLKTLKTQIALSNTYHLMLQPGSELVEKMGGLHKFMGFDGPLLTDSGGYQIFAMGYGSVNEEIKRTSKYKKKSLVKITENGCWFKSYIDGRKIFLSPEISMENQRQLGADLIVQLDECTPYNISYERTKLSMERSMRWGNRSLSQYNSFVDRKQAIYGVIQGGVYSDLRKTSTQYVVESPFFGIAIGGSLGKVKAEMYQVVAKTMKLITSFENPIHKKPIHLLGVGEIEDIFFGVRQGVDTFDCVIPTRLARHGSAIVPAYFHPDKNRNRINLKNSCYREDSSILQTGRYGFSEHLYTKAYLHHLIKSKEILAIQLLTEHNIYQMNLLMEDIREGIKNDNLTEIERFWCG